MEYRLHYASCGREFQAFVLRVNQSLLPYSIYLPDDVEDEKMKVSLARDDGHSLICLEINEKYTSVSVLKTTGSDDVRLLPTWGEEITIPVSTPARTRSIILRPDDQILSGTVSWSLKAATEESQVHTGPLMAPPPVHSPCYSDLDTIELTNFASPDQPSGESHGDELSERSQGSTVSHTPSGNSAESVSRSKGGKKADALFKKREDSRARRAKNKSLKTPTSSATEPETPLILIAAANESIEGEGTYIEHDRLVETVEKIHQEVSASNVVTDRGKREDIRESREPESSGQEPTVQGSLEDRSFKTQGPTEEFAYSRVASWLSDVTKSSNPESVTHRINRIANSGLEIQRRGSHDSDVSTESEGDQDESYNVGDIHHTAIVCSPSPQQKVLKRRPDEATGTETGSKRLKVARYVKFSMDNTSKDNESPNSTLRSCLPTMSTQEALVTPSIGEPTKKSVKTPGRPRKVSFSETPTCSATLETPRRSGRASSRAGTPNGQNDGTLPVLLFGSFTNINNKKKAMEFFAVRGGRVTTNILNANMMCIADGPLRKTLNFIIAVARGLDVVTEAWLIESNRKGTFLDPANFIPADKKHEKEWRFNLKDAINRGKDGLSTLLAGKDVYLTPELKKELRENCREYASIPKVLGVDSVKLAAPTRKAVVGLETVVLGVVNDPLTSKMSRQGHILYTRELLIMAALRGKLETGSDEFRVEDKIKDEEEDELAL